MDVRGYGPGRSRTLTGFTEWRRSAAVGSLIFYRPRWLHPAGPFHFRSLGMFPRVNATICYDIIDLLLPVEDNARARAGLA